MKVKKPKILLFADQPKWAYDHLMQFVIESFNDKYDLYFDYTCNHRFVSEKSFWKKLTSDCLNVARFLWRLVSGRELTKLSFYSIIGSSTLFYWQRSFSFNGARYRRRVLPMFCRYDAVVMFDYYFDRHARLLFNAKKIVKGIYTEGFPPLGCSFDHVLEINPQTIKSPRTFADYYLKNIDALIVGCPSLISRYSQYVKNIHFCTAIYKAEIFTEKRLYQKREGDEIVVGWTGNPNREFKNFYTIVKPAVEALRTQGFAVTLKTRHSGSYESLPDFYSGVDVILIASTRDAGPSMFAEASLCGIPAISNSIGFPSFVIEDGVNGMLVDLKIESYIQRLKYLIQHPEVLYRMSLCAREMFLKKMDNKHLLQRWVALFKSLEL